MRCDILTLFPDCINAVTSHSMLKRAQEKHLLDLAVHNIRDYADAPHYNADDTPYGGGAGMVMKAEPIFRAIDALEAAPGDVRIIMPSPQGIAFTHAQAMSLSQDTRRLVFICGHYEGIDDRVRERLNAEELSIGDYVLTGGELAALVILDAAVRLTPGVLGDPTSAQDDSFADALLDHPHYTRPADVRGLVVPDVLVSGHHEAVRRWRRKAALRNTLYKRPDLLADRPLLAEDRHLLDEIQHERPTACYSRHSQEGVDR